MVTCMHIYAYNPKKQQNLTCLCWQIYIQLPKPWKRIDTSQINKPESGVSVYCLRIVICNQMVTAILKGGCLLRMLLLIFALILTWYLFHIIDH